MTTELKVLELDLTDRDTAIQYIKIHLNKRTGMNWSVRGGRGTSWGWIKIDAMPKQCTWHHVKRETPVDGQEYELRNTGEPHGCMSPEHAEALKNALGLDRVSHQGVSIPASGKYRMEYCQRAAGEAVTVRGEQYWD